MQRVTKHEAGWLFGKLSNNFPEFIITNHALERIRKRLGCNDAKIPSVVVKAWASKLTHDDVSLSTKMSSHNAINVYRVFLGCVFVFALDEDRRFGGVQKTLITIFRISERDQKGL